MKDVLINKGLSEPLKECAEGDGYTQAQWELLDAKAMATICLHLVESVSSLSLGRRERRIYGTSYVQHGRVKVHLTKCFL